MHLRHDCRHTSPGSGATRSFRDRSIAFERSDDRHSRANIGRSALPLVQRSYQRNRLCMSFVRLGLRLIAVGGDGSHSLESKVSVETQCSFVC